MAKTAYTVVLGRVRAGVAVGGLMLLVVAALLSGSDRQSRDFPNSPSFVGWPYDTGAARAKAAQFFIRSGPASAIGYARRAIVSDPVSAQAVSILARAELYSEHPLQARKAFQVSGQLGWRDAMTQIYWLDQALQDNNFRVAAERLDALLRQTPDDENRERFIAAVTATPEGRSALADRLKLAPPWAQALVLDLHDVPVEALLERVDLMRRTGPGVWQCSDSQVIAQKLIAADLLDAARSVWALNCGSPRSLVYDGDFENFDLLKRAPGFAWQVSDRGDVEVSISRDTTGHRAINFSSNATTTLPVLHQLVVIKPGHYRLVWNTRGTPQAQARQLLTSLTCTFDLSRAVEATAVPGMPDTWSRDLIIDQQCEPRQLAFWLPPHVEVHIGGVSLLAADHAHVQ